MTSRLGTGKLLAFYTVYLPSMRPGSGLQLLTTPSLSSQGRKLELTVSLYVAPSPPLGHRDPDPGLKVTVARFSTPSKSQ